MIRSLLIIGGAIVLAGCASLPPRGADATARVSTCPHSATRLGLKACHPFGHTYSGRQLRATGYTSIAWALQALDPSVTAVGPP